jgi:hypothetical protein
MQPKEIEALLVTLLPQTQQPIPTLRRTEIEFKLIKLSEEPSFVQALTSVLAVPLPASQTDGFLILFSKAILAKSLRPIEELRSYLFNVLFLMQKTHFSAKQLKIMRSFLKELLSGSHQTKHSFKSRELKKSFVQYLKGLEGDQDSSLFTDPVRLLGFLNSLLAFISSCCFDFPMFDIDFMQNWMALLLDKSIGPWLKQAVDAKDSQGVVSAEDMSRFGLFLTLLSLYSKCAHLLINENVRNENNCQALSKRISFFFEFHLGCLGIRLEAQVVERDNPLFSRSGNEAFDRQLFRLRKHSVKCLSGVWQMLQKLENSSVSHSAFCSSAIAQFEPVLESLLQALWSHTALAKSGDNQPDFDESRLVSECLGMVMSMSSNSALAQVVLKHDDSVLTGVLLPNLVITATELENFADNPGEFVNCSFDLLESRKSNNLKSAAVDLLLGLSQNVTGFLTKTVHLMALTLTSLLQHPDQILLPRTQKVFQNAWLFHSSNEHLIDSCLSGLSAVHSLVGQRPDLQKEISKCFRLLSQPTFERSLSPLLKTRLVISSTFLIRKVFKIKTERTDDSTFTRDFLLWTINCVSEGGTLAFAAMKCLTVVAKTDKLNAILGQELSVEVVQAAVPLIPTTMVQEFVVMVSKLLVHTHLFTPDNMQLLGRLGMSCVQRIRNEAPTSRAIRGVFIQNCFELLLTLTRNDDFCRSNWAIIEGEVTELFLEDKLSVDNWGEDFVGLFVQSGKSTGRLPSRRVQIMAKLIDDLSRKPYVVTVFAPLLSSFLQLHPLEFDDYAIDRVLQQLKSTLLQFERRDMFFEIQSHVLLILQSILLVCGPRMTQQSVEECQSVFELMIAELTKFKIDRHFGNLDKMVGLMFAILLACDFDRLDTLVDLGRMSAVVSIIADNLQCFNTEHDCKMLTIGSFKLIRYLRFKNTLESNQLALDCLAWLVPVMKLHQVQPLNNFIVDKFKSLDSMLSKFVDEYEELAELLKIKLEDDSEDYYMRTEMNDFGESGDEEQDIEEIVVRKKEKILGRFWFAIDNVSQYEEFRRMVFEDLLFFQSACQNQLNSEWNKYFGDVLNKIEWFRPQNARRNTSVIRKISKVDFN